MKRGLAAVTVALVMVGCGKTSEPAEPPVHRLNVEVTPTASCSIGFPLEPDIIDEHTLPLVVRDADNTVIASESMRADIERYVWAAQVQVQDSGFYQVEVEGLGTTTYSKAELETSGWTAHLDC